MFCTKYLRTYLLSSPVPYYCSAKAHWGAEALLQTTIKWVKNMEEGKNKGIVCFGSGLLDKPPVHEVY